MTFKITWTVNTTQYWESEVQADSLQEAQKKVNTFDDEFLNNTSCTTENESEELEFKIFEVKGDD